MTSGKNRAMKTPSLLNQGSLPSIPGISRTKYTQAPHESYPKILSYRRDQAPFADSPRAFQESLRPIAKVQGRSSGVPKGGDHFFPPMDLSTRKGEYFRRITCIKRCASVLRKEKSVASFVVSFAFPCENIFFRHPDARHSACTIPTWPLFFWGGGPLKHLCNLEAGYGGV